jgi:hypothetical protein
MSHPLTVVSFDPFPSADSYEVRVKDTMSAIVGSLTGLLTTSFQLKDIMGSNPAGAYLLEFRVKVGAYYTAWGAQTSISSFVTTVPGEVQNVTLTD